MFPRVISQLPVAVMFEIPVAEEMFKSVDVVVVVFVIVYE